MQQIYVQRRKERLIEPWDWVLIIGLTLSPMNYLRIWKVGPGELLCMLWGLKHLEALLNRSMNNILSRFWITFLPVISLGAAYGQFFYPSETNLSGLMTWVYFAVISMSVYAGIRGKTPEQIRALLYAIGVTVSCWYMFLYLYSITVNRYFFGIRLWYGGVRFAGGGKNPHLMATLLAVVLSCNVIVLFQNDVSRKKKLISALCVVFCLFTTRASRSSTSIVSIVLTAMAFIVYQLLVRFRDRRERWIAFSLLLIVVTLVVGLFWTQIYEGVVSWISEDANGMGRIAIFKSIVYTMKKNWIFGLGPGIHGGNGTIEYHNMYLEVLAMGGVLGFGIFTAFMARLLTALRVRPVLYFLLLPLLTYGIAGFSMRRLCFWVIVPILIAYAETLRASNQNKAGADQKPAGRPVHPGL